MTEKDNRQFPEQDYLGNQAQGPNEEEEKVHRCPAGKSWQASTVFAAAVALGLVLLTHSPWLWVAYLGLVSLMLLRTGRISTWRAVLFVGMAWLFLTAKLVRGLTDIVPLVNYDEAFLSGQAQKVPNCHIAIGASILNTFYQQYLALKSGAWTAWGPLSLGFLWLAVPLVFGHAFCSWGCFYGGIDDGFSRVFRKPWIRWFRVPRPLRDLPAAILVFMVLVSLATMLPVFCLWVCPLKLSTRFLDAEVTHRLIQGVIFAVVGTAAIVVPLLCRKRFFCGLICPFGAWQAVAGRVNPVRVTVDPGRCTQCQRCVRVCPTFAVGPEDIKQHRVSAYCCSCGECMDQCPEGAIRYTILGRDVRLGWRAGIPGELAETRTLVLFGYLLLGGALGSLCL
jgi:ferredoxin